MRRAVIRSAPTSTASGATKRASPRSTVAPRGRNRASESAGSSAAIAPCTCACTAAQSISGVPRRSPSRPAPRAAVAAWDAASSALLGTQPKFRQSPPIRSRSTSATFTPSCAATAVTESPAEPAPITTRSKSAIRPPPVSAKSPAAATGPPSASSGSRMRGANTTDRSGRSPRPSTSPSPAPIEANTSVPGMMPSSVAVA